MTIKEFIKKLEDAHDIYGNVSIALMSSDSDGCLELKTDLTLVVVDPKEFSYILNKGQFKEKVIAIDYKV